ncbi:hypothetical protein IAD21_03087 [Abditibacteriota bacterium]|nr:hypothetical protein IAD21_03087 [Abditibacteriota bacterium]
MKLLLLTASLTVFFGIHAHAAPTNSLFLPPAAKRLYLSPRIVVIRHRGFHPRYSTIFNAVNFNPQQEESVSGALMDWRHVDAFSIQDPFYSFYYYWVPRDGDLLRIHPSYIGHRTPFRDTKIHIDRKFVVSEFARSELPRVFLHKRAPVMKNTLGNVPLLIQIMD